MKYNIPVKKEYYFKAILLIFNQLGLNLTDLEISIIESMLSRGISIINKEIRKIVREYLNIDQFTFNNYIKRLKDKGVLIKEKDILRINPQLEEKVKDKEVHIIFDIYDN